MVPSPVLTLTNLPFRVSYSAWLADLTGCYVQLWLLFVTVGVTMTPKYWYIWAILILALTCAATPLIAMHVRCSLLHLFLIPIRISKARDNLNSLHHGSAS